MASIREFYAGRSILVTGATGFIGKVLIEKLLRSCPKIDKLYILIRSKKGQSPEERIKAITDLPLFDKLKLEYPNAIGDKLRLINGDVTELGMGLSKSDEDLLIENVSVVFNGAASVRFDDTLKYAVLMNTRGTRELLNLVLKMKKIDVFLHISTTYCNVDHQVVDERLYPPHADWRKTIEIAENIDEHHLQVLTEKYIGALPNTYTFSKSLAEHCVTDLCTGKIPAVVFRPSIVIATRNDPVAGWLDNFNGPIGLLIASGKGILRTCCTNPDLKADYMPVDTCVRALLLAAWTKGTSKDPKEKLDVSFYNCSNNDLYPITMKELIDMAKKHMWEVPLSTMLWYPGGGVTPYRLWYYLNVIFLHLLPAVVIDSILRLLNHKPLLVKIQRRIYIANIALHHFITYQWSFPNYKLLALEERLLPEEAEDFGYDRYNFNVDDYFFNCMKYVPLYLLKEHDYNPEQAKRNLYRMYILDRVVRILVLALIVWYCTCKVNLMGYLGTKLVDFYEAILI
ncbi:hypothetical protein PPYR_04774 [Photinus pyralis]|uniref:Fatty acyl-CoA reductase n=2 Tax=Photinus pyralis TaxID=7054 RepID=A0A5N4AZ98_PHOPY|nr:putative fatty acyl-CoA reductase CG5065 [Photinus pyralis]XP_031335152.1 putative fatty acyl-CoA reductase CG5065 [Photinus pyralis]KAB0802588.1 hypothetical protein PPYR_04774 [Photinus pyralis]